MILTRRYVNIIILLIFVNTNLSIQNSEFSLGHETINTKNPSDWRVIEALAEEHPYVVALLSSMKDYICTGSIINKFCIVTSGNCITYEPKYVAVNTAVYNKKLNNNSIFIITKTKIHGDFIFQLKTADPNDTRMHSNIGLVYVDRPFLEFFINVADLGNFYASELKDKQLTAIGYGSLGSSNLVALQYQIYHQTPCMNPKWYYCVCGIETRTMTKTYLTEFGKGGPALLESTVVGISAAPSGTLYMKNLGIKYNVFTVMGPYVPWIEKFRLPEGYYESGYFRSKGGYCENMSDGQNCKPLQRVGIIGVPFEKGQKKYGVSVAPAALRSAGLIEALQEIENLDIKDYGDIQTTSPEKSTMVKNMEHLSMVSECNKNLSKKVTEVLQDDRIVVTIGGDHSIGVGTVDGHYAVNKDMILIWVDAHADINTNKTSGSGSVHGMPVALCVKEFAHYWPYLPTWEWHRAEFSIKSLGYIGLRSVDEYERLAIEKYRVPCFAMENIEDHGIQKSIHHILKSLDPADNRPIHVSFDIDSLDALEAPSTGTPVRGGLTLREALKMMEIIHATGRLRAVDLVEINPAIGNENDRKHTIEAGISVLKAALGFSRKGSAPCGKNDLPRQN